MLQQAAARQPDLPDVLLLEARLAASGQKIDEASALVDQVIASHPRNVGGMAHEGGHRSREKRCGRREGGLCESAGDAPGQRFRSPERSPGGAHAGNSARRASRWSRFGRRIPIISWRATWLALVEFREGKYGAARDAAMQVLKAAPDHVPSLMMAGSAEFALGSYLQAQAHMERILKDTR